MWNGFFGDLFDFDGDGKLSPMEESMDFLAFVNFLEEDDKEDNDSLWEEE